MHSNYPKEPKSDKTGHEGNKNRIKNIEEREKRITEDKLNQEEIGKIHGLGDFQRGLRVKQNFGYTEEQFYYTDSDPDFEKEQDPRPPDSKERGRFAVEVDNLPMKADGRFIRRFFENFGPISKIELLTENNEGGFKPSGIRNVVGKRRRRNCYVYFLDEESVDRAVFNDGIRMLDVEVRIFEASRGYKGHKELIGANLSGNKDPFQMGNPNSISQNPYISHNRVASHTRDHVHPPENPFAFPSFQGELEYRHHYRGHNTDIRHHQNPPNYFQNEAYSTHIQGPNQASQYPRGVRHHRVNLEIENGEEPIAPKPKKPKKPFKKVKRSPIVYVGNLNYKTRNDQIMEMFSQFGDIIDLRVAYNTSGSVSSFLFKLFRGRVLCMFNMRMRRTL